VILFGPDRRLLWLALRLVYPLNVNHWARVAFAILRKGKLFDESTRLSASLRPALA
jgi:hypothetical protein